MSKNLAMKIMAAVSGAAMLCTSASISSFAVSADSSSDGIVFKADFPTLPLAPQISARKKLKILVKSGVFY